MLRSVLLFFNLFLIILMGMLANAQGQQPSTEYIIIEKIIVEGNKKTKEKIIVRELSIKPSDTLLRKDISTFILKNRNRIFNTTLFNSVDLTLEGDSIYKILKISVKERWYTAPIPFIGLQDRNFNEWWQQRDHDPKRLYYGIDFIQKNVRGRNERLRIKVAVGFYKKVESFYTFPYINKKLTTGLTLHTFFQQNKQVAYKSLHYKLAYFEGDHDMLNRYFAEILLFHRRKFYQQHQAGLGYYYSTVADTIAKLNPRYFLNGRTSQKYISLKYSFISDHRDIRYYPLNGMYLKFEAEKMGIGFLKDNIHQLNLRTEYSLFTPLSHRFFVAGNFTNKLSTPKNQPFFNNRALGYDNDYVSGYELYVINGQNLSLAKANLKWKLFGFSKNFSKIPINQFKNIPFAIYLKAYSDAGYVSDHNYDPENTYLTNQLLWGGGLGLDFVTYYNLVMRLEYSVNRLKETGIFFHLKAGI